MNEREREREREGGRRERNCIVMDGYMLMNKKKAKKKKKKKKKVFYCKRLFTAKPRSI